MKKLLLSAILGLLTLPAIGVHIGDTLEQVLAEKGKPSNQLQAGANTLLTYKEGSIKIRDNKVVAIKSAKELSQADVKGVPPHPVPTSRTASATTDGWTTDYETALAQARSENKKVFVLFTGSDWCIWCQRLEGEILSTPEFKEYAAGKLILVKLDFPRSTPQSDQLKAQNNHLAQQNGIKGFPTVLVLDSSGKRIGKLGYVKGGPAGFLKALSSF